MTDVSTENKALTKPEESKIPIYQPGWHLDISNEDYHRSAGSSSSNLKTVLEGTGMHYQHNKTNPNLDETDTKNLGTAFHVLTLEPEKFHDEVAIRPKSIKVRRGADWEAFKKESEGKAIITHEQFDKAQRMAESVRMHPTTGHLVRNIIAESSIFWWYEQEADFQDDRFSEMLKCRPDGIHKEWPVLIDLKSCASATFTDFMKAMVNYYYHLSGAMYLTGANQCQELLNEVGHFAFTDFVFILVENEPPYPVRAIKLSFKDRQLGDMLFHKAVRTLNHYRDNNWPGFTLDIVESELPAYASRGHIVD